MSDIVRNVRVLTAPAFEPVSRTQAKLWCHVDSDITSQDDIIDLLIAAARERAEQITGRAFIERRLELLMDCFPDGSKPIEIPYPPLQVVEYIRYQDSSGEEVEISGSPTGWILDAGATPGRIAPLLGCYWPATSGMPSNVRIGFRCGYEPVGSPTDEAAYQAALPKLMRNWLHQRISTYYENREAIVIGGQVNEIPRDWVDGLLDGLIVLRRFA